MMDGDSMNVIKRDGRKVGFDKDKIYKAIIKAAADIDGINPNIEKSAKRIAREIASIDEDLSVEEIQDMVEDKLMFSSHKEVAKAYIRYRYLHKMARSQYNELMNAVAEKLTASNVSNQNANIDEYSFGGRMGEANDVVTKQYAIEFLLSPLAKYNHINNRIYEHDLNNYAVGNHNCLSLPFDDLLANGFNTRQTDIRAAQSVDCANQLVAVLFQLQSLQQFGGVSATHLDWTMVPYIRKSFVKHWFNGLKYAENFVIDDDERKKYKENAVNVRIDDEIYTSHAKAYQYALDMLHEEVYQSVEALYHNLNSLQSRSGNQLPFTSINYGTCTLPEGRLYIKALLDKSIEGIGKLHRTPIFPCSIFQLKKGVNRNPGDPNYDLFKLALKSTSLRLYPNYANVDWSVNTGYNPEDPTTYVATMGCVDGEEIVTYKYHDNLYVESIARMWERLSGEFNVNVQNQYTGYDNVYIDLQDVQIFDTKKGFVNTSRIVRNLSNNWVDVHLTNGRRILCTPDHPFDTENRGVVLAADLLQDDVIIKNNTQYSSNEINFDTTKAWLLGFMLCDGCYSGGSIFSSIAFQGEDDIESEFIKAVKYVYDLDVRIKEQHRGVKGDYKDLIIQTAGTNKRKELAEYFISMFGGLNKIDRQIPNCVFSWREDAKLAFLAGMIDADGYINNSHSRHGMIIVQIGSTNKELALQQMALAQTLDMPTRMYYNYYKADDHSKIRYRIEFVPTDALMKYIICEKKKSKFNLFNHKPYDNVTSVVKVETITKTGFSYDVTTDSEHFEISGIYSHNCRTYNGFDINGLGQQKDGRGNICPVTIILPTLAMEAKEKAENNGSSIIDEFIDIFDKAIDDARVMLNERYEWICSQNESAAKFMYENHTMAGYKPEEGIRSALKHGTLAIGILGMAECLQVLVGCNHTQEKGMDLAKRLCKLLNTRCKEFKEKYKLNYATYYTPAENLCYTAMMKFRKKYGIIPNVSENDYFTNSIHIPVWENMSAFEKIDLESQLTGYSNAGCITYVELDSDCKYNLDALETLVNYAMDKDVPYFAINVPNDQCMNCGYCDTIDETCPQCGSTNIKRLRRVTGYLTNDYKTAFNKGKQQETEMRVKHNQKISFPIVNRPV